MRKLILIILIVLVASSAWAAPSTPTVSGSMTNGSTITLNGSGFGTKNTPTPLHWHRTDNTNPTYGSYYRAPSTFSTSVTRRGAGTRTFEARRGGSGANDEISPYVSPALGVGAKFFAYFWRRLNFTPDNSDNIKFFFLGNPSGGRGPGYSYLCPALCLPALTISERCGSATGGGGTPSFGHTSGNWYNEISIVQMSSSVGSSNASHLLQFLSAAGARSDRTGTGTSHCSTDSSALSIAIIDAYGNQSGYQYIDDIYMDTTWSRVMLGNNASFASCTHFEMLIPQTWNDTTITALANVGTFSNGSTAYVFVVDSNNVASAGRAVTIGSAPTTGTITATISGGDGNGRWRVKNYTPTDTWHTSGETKTVESGTYSVEFQAVSGWTTPADITGVVVTAGGNTNAGTGTYVRQTGSLKVNILPAGAVTAGAQWRRVGTTPWFNSAATESSIPTATNVQIEFKSTTGYTVPATIGNVTVSNGALTTVGPDATTTYAAVNETPYFISTADTSAVVNATYEYTAVAVDDDLNNLTYSLTVFPSGMTIDGSTGVVTWLPGASALGPNNVTVRVTDDGSPAAAADQSYVLTVSGNPAPVQFYGNAGIQ